MSLARRAWRGHACPMKTYRAPRLAKLLPLAAATLAFAAEPRAQTPDITGEWWYLLFDLPHEVRFNGGKLVGGDSLSISTDKILYFQGASGPRFQNLVVTEENGPYQITPQLGVRHIVGSETLTTYLNNRHDIMIWAGGHDDPDDPVWELTYSIKPPASFTIAQLAGTWDTRQLEMPDRLTAPFLTADSPIVGAERFATEQIEGLTIDANGLVQVPGEGTIGVFIVEQGLPTLFADGQKDGFFINASLDVMVRSKPDTTEETGQPNQILTLAIKRAQGLTVADVVGQWHFTDINVPRWMTVQGNSSNRSVQGGRDFDATSARVTICPNGQALVENFDGEPGQVLAWRLNAQGMVEVELEGGFTPFSVNQSKNFMAAVTDFPGGNTRGMLSGVKYSSESPCSTPAPELRLEQTGGQWQVVWSGGDLQTAPTPSGPWTDLANASSPMPLAPTAAQAYYRAAAR